MPFDVNGTFTRNYTFEQDRVNGIKIMSLRVDGEFDNFSTAMNQTLLRTGAAPMSANLRMGGFALTNLGDGTVANPSITFANDASSGLYRVGSNQIGMAVAGVKRAQWDSSGITGIMNASGAGSPLTINSADSTNVKALLKDAGVTTAKIGSNATTPFQVQDGSGTTLINLGTYYCVIPATDYTFGYDTLPANLWLHNRCNGTFIIDDYSFGGVLAAQDLLQSSSTRYFSVDTFIVRNNAQTATYGQFDSNGLTIGSTKSLRLGDNVLRRNDGTAILTYAASLITFGNDIATTNVEANGLVKNTTANVTAPGANASSAYMWRDATNGMCIQGAGSSFNASLMNRAGNRVIGVNDNVYKAEYQGTLGASQVSAELGWRDIQNQSKTATYALVLADRGSMVNITTGGVTVPDNSSVAFPVGSIVTVYNDSASNQTISMTGTDTLRLGGTASTGSRTLAQRGLANLVKVKTTEWVINGSGVS
jgi:hypothetical protein